MNRFIECVNCAWVGCEELIFKRNCVNCDLDTPKRASREKKRMATKLDMAQIKLIQDRLQQQKESASWIK